MKADETGIIVHATHVISQILFIDPTIMTLAASSCSLPPVPTIEGFLNGPEIDAMMDELEKFRLTDRSPNTTLFTNTFTEMQSATARPAS